MQWEIESKFRSFKTISKVWKLDDTSFLLKTFHKNSRPLLVLQETSSHNHQQSNSATAIKPKQNYFLPQKKKKETSNTSTHQSQKLFPIFEKYDSYPISIKKTHHRNWWQLREQKVVLFYYYIYKPKTKLGGGIGLNWEPPLPSAFLPSVPVSAQYAICMVLVLPGALGFCVPWRLSTGAAEGINKLIIPPSNGDRPLRPGDITAWAWTGEKPDCDLYLFEGWIGMVGLQHERY